MSDHVLTMIYFCGSDVSSGHIQIVYDFCLFSVPGIIGCLQALEVVKIITQIGCIHLSFFDNVLHRILGELVLNIYMWDKISDNT